MVVQLFFLIVETFTGRKSEIPFFSFGFLKKNLILIISTKESGFFLIHTLSDSLLYRFHKSTKQRNQFIHKNEIRTTNLTIK